MARVLSVGFLLVAGLMVSCGSGAQRVDLGPVENIAGLVEASAKRGGVSPKLVAGYSPEVSRQVANELDEAVYEVRAVVRVLVTLDGEVLGVRTLEIDPPESEAAQHYAQAIWDAVWNWDYRSGGEDRAYLDLTFIYPRSGDQNESPAQNPRQKE